MDLFELAKKAKSKEDLIVFLEVLIESFNNDSIEWENLDIPGYLEAMQTFLKSSTEESFTKVDFTPSWSLFANILYVAKNYE